MVNNDFNAVLSSSSALLDYFEKESRDSCEYQQLQQPLSISSSFQSSTQIHSPDSVMIDNQQHQCKNN